MRCERHSLKLYFDIDIRDNLDGGAIIIFNRRCNMTPQPQIRTTFDCHRGGRFFGNDKECPDDCYSQMLRINCGRCSSRVDYGGCEEGFQR